MQWWCSSTGRPWDWGWQAYPGVWLFLALLAMGILRWNAAGYRAAGARSSDTLRGPSLGLGLASLWLALDWPIGALGAGYLASMHMLQFILIAMIGSPFLVRGIAPEALRLLERRPRLLGVLRWLTRPVIALVLFNAIVAVTHVPEIVDAVGGRVVVLVGTRDRRPRTPYGEGVLGFEADDDGVGNRDVSEREETCRIQRVELMGACEGNQVPIPVHVRVL